MNRRQFGKGLAAALSLCGAGGTSFFARPSTKRPQVAVTIDDFRLFDAPRLAPAPRNRAMLDALRAHKVRAAVFVSGKNVEAPEARALLRAWDADGHTLANHSYSHLYYHSPEVTFERFAADLVRGEEVLKEFPRFRKLFRFPYLKEGDTRAKRDSMRAFLRARGYRNGHVTIDASDWYVDQRLRARLARDPRADASAYRDFYLAHIRDRARFYDDLARRVTGRAVKHTLLLHHNLLNGLFLGDLLHMFEREGWKLIEADEAFRDPVFASEPDTLPAGESLVWALAKQSGRFEHLLRYPGEDGDYEKARMDALGL